jgi:hypothetical protein
VTVVAAVNQKQPSLDAVNLPNLDAVKRQSLDAVNQPRLHVVQQVSRIFNLYPDLIFTIIHWSNY